jgi:hypothetical protein
MWSEDRVLCLPLLVVGEWKCNQTGVLAPIGNRLVPFNVGWESSSHTSAPLAVFANAVMWLETVLVIITITGDSRNVRLDHS